MLENVIYLQQNVSEIVSTNRWIDFNFFASFLFLLNVMLNKKTFTWVSSAFLRNIAWHELLSEEWGVEWGVV